MSRTVYLVAIAAFPSLVFLVDAVFGSPGARVVPDEPAEPGLFTAASHVAQLSGRAGEVLADSLTLIVSDDTGRPARGMTVTWVVTAGEGVVSPATVTTDKRGLAKTQWTLGGVAGPQSVEAHLSPSADSIVEFAAAVRPGRAVRIDRATEDGADSNSTAIRVTDRFGNAVSGVPVAWIVTSGAGAPSDDTTRTDARGMASVMWSPGPPGIPESLTAVMPELAGSPVVFTRSRVGTTWVRRIVGVPPARSGHAMAFDEERRVALLFGGRSSDDGELNDAWTWGRNGWAQVTATPSPPSRSRHAMTYDALSARVVLFGGESGGRALDDTWQWDGSVWVSLNPSPRPSARRAHAMSYDRVRGRVLLFGGVDGTGRATADLWAWDGTEWERVLVAGNVPAARAGHVLAYDRQRNRAVLFGGTDPQGRLLSDTWEWDGDRWIDVTGSPSPPGRNAATAAFDADRGRVVLFGGQGASGPLDDAWEWTGERWSSIRPFERPPGREGGVLVFDGLRQRPILYAGRDAAQVFADTWELRRP